MTRFAIPSIQREGVKNVDSIFPASRDILWNERSRCNGTIVVK